MKICNCEICGKSFYRKPIEIKKGHNRFCSLNCFGISRIKEYSGKGNPFYGKRHSNKTKMIISKKRWKCGWGMSSGYLRYTRCGKKPNMLLHREVAEKIIGRRLRKEEVVHHIDGNKTDNRKDNLMVMVRSDHMMLHHQLKRVGRLK